MLISQTGIVSALWMLSAFSPNTIEQPEVNTMNEVIPRVQAELSFQDLWPIATEELPQVWEVAFQIKQATSSQLGASGRMRDTQPVFGSQSKHAYKNYHSSRGYARAYHTPAPLVTSMSVARRATYRSIFGGRRRW